MVKGHRYDGCVLPVARVCSSFLVPLQRWRKCRLFVLQRYCTFQLCGANAQRKCQILMSIYINIQVHRYCCVITNFKQFKSSVKVRPSRSGTLDAMCFLLLDSCSHVMSFQQSALFPSFIMLSQEHLNYRKTRLSPETSGGY